MRFIQTAEILLLSDFFHRRKGIFMDLIKNEFDRIIEENDIFGMTRSFMKECLKNWFEDNPEAFTEDMGADFDTVMTSYRFYDEKVSFDKNFNFDPPLNTVTCIIEIRDQNDDICMHYRGIYDCKLNMIDDYILK